MLGERAMVKKFSARIVESRQNKEWVYTEGEIPNVVRTLLDIGYFQDYEPSEIKKFLYRADKSVPTDEYCPYVFTMIKIDKSKINDIIDTDGDEVEI